MSLLESKAIALPRGDATSQVIKPDATRQKEAARAKLQKATKEFESLFSFYMLKAMRQSVSFGKDKQEGFLSSGLGKDTFTEMFDMKMAEKIATRGKQSISALMYNQMVKQIDQKDAEHPLDTSLKAVRETHEPAFQLIAHPSASSPQKHFTTDNLPLVVSPPTETKDLQAAITDIQAEPFEFDLTPIPTKQIEVMVPSENFSAVPQTKISSEPLVSSAHRQIFALYGEQIERASRITSLDSSLIASVIHAESSGDSQAVSASGAKGLMQLMDSTAVQYDVSKPFDPQENITGGSRYLRDLIDRFGDLKLALAAYNAGPSNVRKFNGVPPFAETINYVSKVLDGYAPTNETSKLPAAKEISVADR
jgi:soluble lytic murein transglycosylase-like protein